MKLNRYEVYDDLQRGKENAAARKVGPFVDNPDMPEQSAEDLKRLSYERDAKGVWPHKSYLIIREETGGNAQLLVVTRPDGGEIPKSLQGRWTSLRVLKEKIDHLEAKSSLAN